MLVQADNRSALGVLEGLGDSSRRHEGRELELVIELPRARGIGAQLAQALRAAAAGPLVAGETLAHRVADSNRAAVRPARPIRTIVAGTDGSPTADEALGTAVQLDTSVGARLHVVSAYRTPRGRTGVDAALAAAKRAAVASGVEAVTHAGRRRAGRDTDRCC